LNKGIAKIKNHNTIGHLNINGTYMDIQLFKNKTTKAILECGLLDSRMSLSSEIFLREFEEIFSNKEISDHLKMTQMTVLFEGFYNSLSDTNLLKPKFLNIRLERWKHHFGTPFIEFLITFQKELEQTKKIFIEESSFSTKPWHILDSKNLNTNKENFICMDEKSISKIPVPEKNEKKGEFLKTYNHMGGFTTTPSDPVSRKFIKFIEKNKESVVLEIGAAFGAATLKALSKNAIVYCNDIDPQNLAVVKNRYLNHLNNESKKDAEKSLILLPAAFPDELKLPNNFFDAILICRVLHFFRGEKIDESLSQLFKYLKPGGKLFVVCETPYLKNWIKFIPEYQKRELEGQEWPGEISDPENFENSGFVASLPKFVHWISRDVLAKCLKKADFEIEHLSYIDRQGQFPEQLLLDGRESIGAVAVKKI